MKTEFVNPLVEAAFDVLEEILATDISRRRASTCSDMLALHRVTALVAISGSVEGRVLVSMPLDVALSIAAVISNEETAALDEVTQLAITGLADTIVQEALPELTAMDIEVEAAPAVLVTGQGMQLSCTEIEAVAVPLQMPLGTVELVVALRERVKD